MVILSKSNDRVVQTLGERKGAIRNEMSRIIRDLVCILLILIMPMWLMELLEIDVLLLNIIAESEDKE